MRAQVIRIESGTQFTDNDRRVTLRFESADLPFNTIRFSVKSLAVSGLALDDWVSVQVNQVDGEAR